MMSIRHPAKPGLLGRIAGKKGRKGANCLDRDHRVRAPEPGPGVRSQLLCPSRVIVYQQSDWELVRRYRDGDRAAFSELMTRYQRPVYNAAYGVLHCVEDARDITQDVFLKVAERLSEYDPQYKFFSWIYRIALNESLNLQRRNGRKDPRDVQIGLPAADNANPEKQIEDAQLAERIRSAMMRMSDSDRSVLVLRHFSECSYEEIGQILDLDGKTVKSRLFESRQRLRGLLADLE
jgi:RNA polymerase sigma-70 factor, ECF subfamily